ncbi:MAG: hypothetical protein ACLRWQ_14800 [Flavonifractor plautii]
MYRIKTLNKISPAGLSVLDQTRYTISTDVENEDGILVRSADMHDYAFPDALRAVARAGAGTNNIPIDRCSEAGIVVFNTPGANANAVKELVLCAHAAGLPGSCDGVASGESGSRPPPAWTWTTAVEKGKSRLHRPGAVQEDAGRHRPGGHRRHWSPTSPSCPWAWMCTATTPSCLWTPPCRLSRLHPSWSWTSASHL